MNSVIDSTAVPCPAPADGDESASSNTQENQVQVQNMFASRFLSTFEAEQMRVDTSRVADSYQQVESSPCDVRCDASRWSRPTLKGSMSRCAYSHGGGVSLGSMMIYGTKVRAWF